MCEGCSWNTVMSSASYETHQAITSIKIHDDHLIAGTLEGSLVNFQIIKQNAKLKLQKLKSAKHHDSCVNSIDLSPQLLVTASRSGDIHLHFREDLYTSSPVKLRVSEREVSIYNVKVNSMESKIIACCEDGSIIQWDTSSDEESLIYQSHSSSILTDNSRRFHRLSLPLVTRKAWWGYTTWETTTIHSLQSHPCPPMTCAQFAR